MKKDKKIPEMTSYEEMAKFWDNHSLADYWELTEPADFEISPNIGRRYMVAIDSELINRIGNMARVRGLRIESLVNLLLEQRLNKIGKSVRLEPRITRILGISRNKIIMKLINFEQS